MIPNTNATKNAVFQRFMSVIMAVGDHGTKFVEHLAGVPVSLLIAETHYYRGALTLGHYNEQVVVVVPLDCNVL